MASLATNHLSPASSPLQATTADGAVSSPASSAPLSPGACNNAFCFRGGLPGQAAGSFGAILQDTKIWKQVRLPLPFPLLGTPLRAVSGTDEPLNSHVRPASPRWLSPKSRREPLNSFLRSRIQDPHQARGVFNVLLRQLRGPFLHVENVAREFLDDVLRISAPRGENHG